MASTAKTRLTCSLEALGIVWVLSGLLFITFANGSGLLGAWLVGGTAIFLVGWIVVGLPMVALGDRVSSTKSFPVVVTTCGVAGAFILFLPDLLIRIMDQNHQYTWSLSDLGWPGIAFLIAAATALTYCVLLRKSSAGENRSGDEAMS